MRDFRFRAWDEAAKEMIPNCNQGWEGDVFNWLNEGHPITIMQYTGLKDKNGKEIYEGDLLNICFTSESGEFIHDGIYEASISSLEGLVFRFVTLLWISFGYNQYPINSELKRSNKLWSVYADNREYLCVQDTYKRPIDERCRFPFNEESELSFHSRYIEIIGNIHENKELLEK